MNKFAISAAAIALSLGALPAAAQTYQSQTTTEQTSPDGQTTTTTTERSDADGTYRKTVTSHYGDTYGGAETSGYTRFGVGDHVPVRILDNDDATVDNFDDFNLSPPPYGFKWMRFGNDALLVNERTGRVIQADYNLFE